MTETLINKKAEESEVKTISEIILAKEERSNISDIINNVRYWFMLYRDDKQKLEQDYLLDEINDLNDVKKYINYDQQVDKVKDIFANIKERLTEEEQGQADLLEKNALEIMEKLTQGIDYWEDLELRELAEFWMEEAQVHLDAIETSERWNKSKEKVLLEREEKKEKLLNEERQKRKSNEKQLVHNLVSLNWVRNMTIEYNETLYNIKAKALEGQLSDKTNELRESRALLKASQEEAEKEKSQNKKLRKELEEQKKLLRKFQEENERQLTQNRELKQENLEEKNKTKELEKKMALLNKLFVEDLPPLPKKENRFKALGTKIKTKTQHLVEKTKKQSQELIAKIEVKVK